MVNMLNLLSFVSGVLLCLSLLLFCLPDALRIHLVRSLWGWKRPTKVSVAMPQDERAALRAMCSSIGTRFLGVFGAPGLPDRLLVMPTTGPLADSILEVRYSDQMDEIALLLAIRDAAEKKRFPRGKVGRSEHDQN
jgi:hypothetical protein